MSFSSTGLRRSTLNYYECDDARLSLERLRAVHEVDGFKRSDDFLRVSVIKKGGGISYIGTLSHFSTAKVG